MKANVSGSITESLILLVLDGRVPYLGAGADSPSLLTLPLGTSTVLDRLVWELKGTGREFDQVLVAPCFSAPEGYAEAIRDGTRCAARVVSNDELSVLLADRESCDDLLLVDPRYWPVGGYTAGDLALPAGEYRGVSHIVAIGGRDQIQEWVERDRNGRVKGVPRFYGGVDWPQVATSRLCMSVLAARVVDPPAAVDSLPELRAQLASRGMLSRDVALPREVYDLHDPEALLALNERMLMELKSWRPQSGFNRLEPGVWAGEGCQVAANARLVAPVVLHPGTVIEDGATVIGPAAIGAGSRIGEGALVAQSLLAPKTLVGSGRTVRERVLWDGASSEPPAGAEDRKSAVKRGWGARHGGRPPLRLTPVRPEAGEASAPRQTYESASRVLNAVLAGLGLILLIPVWIVIGLMIKLDSRGPVFFGHTREGRGGRPFRCWKFRTMVSDAHRLQRALYRQNEVDGPQFMLSNDPRVTRVGRLLRATNLDEFPQLWNVLLGHMSLVGPRPSPFRENQICVPWRRARLSVRPGITGLWQLCRARRDGGDFHQWIYFDLTYVRHRSLRLDAKILLATVLTLGGRWSVPLDWLIPRRERGPVGEHGVYLPVRPQRIAGAAALMCLALGGCHDPRISLQEFVQMTNGNHAPEVAPVETPAGPLPVDRAIVPYRVGPADVLGISMVGAEAGTGFPLMQARVDRNGMIDLPLVGKVAVGDKEIEDVEEAIRAAYVPGVVKEIVVHVEVLSADATQVLVVGAVTNPGLVNLRRTERNLLYALVAAGGATQDSSGKARLQRVRRPGEDVTFDLTDPRELDTALAQAPLEDGDIVTVIPAQPNLVFVGGLVNAPNPQPYPPGTRVTLLQAIAAANGLRTDVTPTEATLIRRMPDGNDVHVKIDIPRVTTARDPNIELAEGDILWVPDTIGTRVQDWVNRNIYIRAGASVHYDVSGIEFMNRHSQQSGQLSGGSLEDSFDPFGFLNRNQQLNTIVNRPPVVP